MGAAIDGEVGDASVVVISDYGKGVVSPAVAAHAVKVARAAGKPVIVDTKALDLSVFRGASLLTPNARELGLASRMPAGSDDEVAAAGAHLVSAFDLGGLVVTRAERGMTVIERGRSAVQLATEAREVFEQVALSDEFVEFLTLAAYERLP